MEGLEVSEVLLSEVLVDNENKRIDSEYFKKDFLKFFHNVPNLKPLSYFAKEGYRVVYENTEIVDTEEGKANNYPYFLQATDLETPFIKTDNLFYVNETEWKRYPKGRIQKGEILIEVKGKIEKVSIVPDDFPEKTLVSGSLFKLTVNDKISKNVFLCYLISKYGVAFKDRYKTNLLISYVSKPDLYRIPIPDFSKNLQIEIDKKFELIFEKRKKSQTIYRQAEELLLETIGLKDFKPSQEKTNIKTFKESFLATGRLDAEYYQPKYEDYIDLVKDYRNGFELLQTACNLKDNNFTPEETKEYQYIELADIGKSGNVTGCTVAQGNDLPSRARRKINTNDVIISSIEGSLESCALITDDYDNALCSTGFYVVNSEKVNSETLLVLFKSEVMQNILKQGCSGTILTAINKTEFQNIPIPLIDLPTQQQISALIQESFALRKESERLLVEAKDMVEREIER